MGDNTYIELNKGGSATIQLNMWKKTTGEPFTQVSGGFYTVKGTAKDNIVVPKTSVENITFDNINYIYATITTTVTISAAEYDVRWEINREGGNKTMHCTKLLVVDNC